jgi:protein-S-isoprenylcysteine O-methyltransferase Ste14
MSKKLFLEAMTKIIMGIIIIGLLIFIPAGSIEFFNGWLFIILLFVPMFVAGIFMMINNPELLKRRLNAKEKEGEQKEVVALSGIMFIVGFIIAGLNYRYNWMELSNTIVVIGSILFLLSYFLYSIVLIQNEYLLRTIEVEKDQKLVDTGLYGIIRHPMYLATISLFLSMPLILGSFYSFIIFLAYPFIIVKRIKNEEKVLEKDLKGYKEYEKKVKYRLIPYIW